ncbi:MAG TPA: DUF1844 domain-containing protein [Candidatus Binatia bacterium]|jgi:hypothetical protein|nr:DUF1844 domain-containing protein [Candidatus Binatia bacterium]
MAAEEKESERGFRVQDRRRFASTSDEPRAGESAEQPAEPSPPEEPTPPPHAESRQSTFSALRPEISFSSFLLGLSTQALMYMGEIPPAPGQPPQKDLSVAQQMIDVLAMLKQKTTGNLDAGEEAMLENALFDLRMRYVELAKKDRAPSQGKD